jgi:hypothetical protein
MRKTKYQDCLRAFVTEIEDLQSPAFVNPDQWILSPEILNAVLIGYEIESFTDRKKLHEVGRKHGLIRWKVGEWGDYAHGLFTVSHRMLRRQRPDLYGWKIWVRQLIHDLRGTYSARDIITEQLWLGSIHPAVEPRPNCGLFLRFGLRCYPRVRSSVPGRVRTSGAITAIDG